MTYDVDDATYRRAATMWAFMVLRQGDRLDDAAGEYNKARLDQLRHDQRDTGTVSEDWAAYMENGAGDGMNWWVTWTLGADQYFFLAAAAQLRKCVMKLPDDGLPDVPDERMILLLRNFTEHWEDPTGWSVAELRNKIPDATPGRAAFTNKDVWIEGVSTSEIVVWAWEVDRKLRADATVTGDLLPDPYEPLPAAFRLHAGLSDGPSPTAGT